MNNSELNELLKVAQVPERSQEYWEQFPRRVITRTERGPQAVAEPFGKGFRIPGFAYVAISLCCFLGILALCLRRSHSETTEMPLAEAQTYLHEIEALFPNQVRAIVFDQQGAHLLLAEKADVPTSQPVFLKVCGATGCERFLTFSGAQIPINGEPCEVLVNPGGNVILMGQKIFWFSGKTPLKDQRYRIEARTLQAT